MVSSGYTLCLLYTVTPTTETYTSRPTLSLHDPLPISAPAGAWLSGPCKEKGAAAPLFACRDVVAASVLHPTPRCAAHVVGRHHLHGEAEGALLARVHG